MNKEKIYRILNANESNFFYSDIKKELDLHLNKDIDFYFEPKTKEDGYYRLIYLEDSVCIYLQFKLETFKISYLNTRNIVAVVKTSGYVEAIFSNYKISTTEEFMKNPTFKNEIENLFSILLTKLKENRNEQI